MYSNEPSYTELCINTEDTYNNNCRGDQHDFFRNFFSWWRTVRDSNVDYKLATSVTHKEDVGHFTRYKSLTQKILYAIHKDIGLDTSCVDKSSSIKQWIEAARFSDHKIDIRLEK